MIGDEFIRESTATLKSLGRLTLQKRPITKQGQQAEKPNKMFLFSNFNVRTYYSNLATRGLNRIIYPFVEALNARHHLPQYVILVPDKDMISKLKSYQFNTSLTMGKALSYLIGKMDSLLNRRRHDLADKRLSALAPDDHPIIVWVRMLKRPFIEGAEAAQIFSLRNKFNGALEEQILNSKNDAHRIMGVDVRLDEFDKQGNLTAVGKNSFWREVDIAMKKLNLGDIKLLPRKHQQQVPSLNLRKPNRPSREFLMKVAEQYNNNSKRKRNSSPARKHLWSPITSHKHRNTKKNRSRSLSRSRSRPSHGHGHHSRDNDHHRRY